jgi:predicted transcriptional regulator
MRTTIDIDDDVLCAVKELAAAQKTTAGKVISDLVRQELTRPPSEPAKYRGGFRLLPQTGKVVTPELIEKLLEEDI